MCLFVYQIEKKIKKLRADDVNCGKYISLSHKSFVENKPNVDITC